MIWLVPLAFVACGPSGSVRDPLPADVALEMPARRPEVANLRGLAPNLHIVPSLPESQRAMAAAGIDVRLVDLVNRRTFDVANPAADRAAVRTGVVLADLLLTIKHADRDVLLGQLSTVESGLRRLGGPAAVDRLQEVRSAIEADAMSRDEVLEGFHTLSRDMMGLLKEHGQQRFVPLIQAGAFLEGANVIARALLQAEATPEGRSGGDDLLKQRKAVRYFQRYLRQEAAGDVDPEVQATLLSALGELQAVVDKAEPLSRQDLLTVVSATDAVLALL